MRNALEMRSDFCATGSEILVPLPRYRMRRFLHMMRSGVQKAGRTGKRRDCPEGIGIGEQQARAGKKWGKIGEQKRLTSDRPDGDTQ